MILRICNKLTRLGLSLFLSFLSHSAMAQLPIVSSQSEVCQQSVQKRRIALRDSILSCISGASIANPLKGNSPKNVQEINILKMGARNNGTYNCLPAFNKAIRRASAKKGVKIIVPKGTYYLCGPIVLRSNVCIDLQEGAVLKFAPDAKYYPMVNTSWEGTFLYNHSPFIYGYQVENVAITGKGTIDGNAMTTFATWRPKQKPAQLLSRQQNHEEVPIVQRKFGQGQWLRPQLIQLYQSKNITLEGVKIINSPFWCIHLLKSENIICRRLRYDAKLVNNDGIDPEMSRNILIEDIHFNNGDDNVAIKSGRDNDGWHDACPAENIVIRNCHFKGLHAVVIGSEMSAGVRNVFVENCDYAGYCKRGVFIKTNPDRGGFVSHLFVNNCKFDEVEDLFYVTSRYAGEGQESMHFSTIEHLYVDGLSARKVRAAALVLQGTSAKPVQHVSFNAIEVGEASTGISFENVEDVQLGECHIGKPAGTPTQVSAKDKIF